MEPMYYIGLDVHKRIISYCVKDSNGKIYSEGSIPATCIDLDRWMKTLPMSPLQGMWDSDRRNVVLPAKTGPHN
jgi:transposase